MINILLNSTNFDQPWAAETLVQILKPHMRTVILPLSYDYGWASDADDWRLRYDDDSAYSYDLLRPLRSYGISGEDISVLDYYSDDPEEMERRILRSDLLVLVGEDPDACMERLDDLCLTGTIRSYNGIVMGLSAGSKIQQEAYFKTIDEDMEFSYRQGLGLLHGFDLDTHYVQDVFHLTGLIRSIETQNLPVAVLPEKGGMLVGGNEFVLMGEAFIAGVNDLDELYSLYEAERDREF
ncbi:MAG: hypothetical protein IJ130_14970 [Solobacterium sp.]|nr:hypothetical protein [Erysipelotrichaceae bacterium]MBQ9155102.1 hypothetical protein [Solobacterium sp.]